MSGKLFVVATPLGNLQDLSPRALETLRGVDWIACEDTRRTAKLLAHGGVTTPTVSCHRFNERERLDSLVERLLGGEQGALVSDAGTPAVSDPGAELVRAALDAGLGVCPVPGPSAVATLLSVSGLPADRYVFEGFLPHRAGERRRRLRELRAEPRTWVCFEAPHRIVETLRDFGELYGGRELVVGRELTKLHETLLRGPATHVMERLGDEPKGEFVVGVAGHDPAADDSGDEKAERIVGVWRDRLGETGDRRAALKKVARETGYKRAELYRLLVELGEIEDG
ncbi:MAG: 16S rRNA (cytidine(1402)-2'-O)-methyltransferase [bacterium]|nr:16S rRNA (cytidine(1402)-2'-O)-methyltransferase [bacterium]